jgi:hypothetical protein
VLACGLQRETSRCFPHYRALVLLNTAVMANPRQCRHRRRLRIRLVKKQDSHGEFEHEFTVKLAITAKTMKQMARQEICDLCQFLCRSILEYAEPNVGRYTVGKRNRWTGPVWMTFRVTAADLQVPITTAVYVRFYWEPMKELGHIYRYRRKGFLRFLVSVTPSKRSLSLPSPSPAPDVAGPERTGGSATGSQSKLTIDMAKK